MNEFWQNFHFIRPLVLILLVFPAIMLFLRAKTYAELSSWEEVCDKNLLQYLLIKGKDRKRKNLFRLIFFGLCSAIIAAAGPTWKQKELPAIYEQNPLIIALELSTDMDNDDKSPNNLARAKYIISDILQASPDTQSGMIVYTHEPFMISPISEDYKIINNLLPAVDISIMPANGNRADRAINLAVDKMKNAGFPYGNILLITTDSGANASQAIEAAKKAKNAGYKTSVMQISQQTNELLQKISEAGGGIYLNLRNNPLDFSDFIKQSFDKKSEESKNKISLWKDFGYYLLFIPMICCLLLFRRGIFVFAAAFFAFSKAYAGFFLNNNQEGLRAFNNQQYEKAAEKFEDTKWQGSALYKAEKFAEALEKFEQDTSETGLYNQGNALAKSGKIEDAIKKYEQVLEINPNNKDAAFNLEYLKQQQENQQNQSSSEENNDNDENQDSRNSSGGQDEQNQDEQEQASSSQPEEKNKDEQNTDTQNQKEQSQSDEADNDNQQNQDSQSFANQGEPDANNEAGKQQNSARNQNNDDSPEQPQTPPQSSFAPLQNKDDKTTSEEEALAKAQQYRLIETDPGGLLREFIRAEYMKNRYKE